MCTNNTLMMVYIKVLVMFACFTDIVQGNTINSIHKQNYLRGYTKKWSSAYLPDISVVGENSTCGKALKEFDEAIIFSSGPEDIWALNMVDSWGKSNDGFYWGIPFLLGQYDQCLHTVSSNKNIQGKYCSIMRVFPTPFGKDVQPIDQPVQGKNHINEPFSQEMIQTLSTWIPGTWNFFYSVSYGTCIPDACSEQELADSIVNVLDPDHGLYPLFCHDKDWNPELDAVDISFIVFCSVIVIFMLVGTAAYMYIQYTKKEYLAKGPLKFLLPFAVTANLKKLFAVNSRPAPGTISCLNGMRVMSMCWVVWGHQVMSTIYAAKNETTVTFSDRLNTFLNELLLKADLSVDTFFFMSGLLVCYGVMREMNKTGSLNVILYYVHRILRLTPPIAMVAWYFSSVHRYTFRGPIPVVVGTPQPMEFGQYCQENLWRDVTFTNQIPWNDTSVGSCLGQCWYTSVDMQLYALAPLVLLPLYYFKIGGQIWMFMVTLAAIGMRGFVAWNAGSFSEEKRASVNPWLYETYTSTWTRADAWLIGAWTGYLIAKMGKRKLKLNQWMVLVGWTVAVVLGLMVQFGRYDGSYIREPPADSAGHMMYAMMHRACWAACLAWITITCHYGYGGIVNDFLSHPSWQPFSRLTFGMYLFGMNITMTYVSTSKIVHYYSNLDQIWESCGILFCSCIYAVLLSLMIEAPILGLEKILLKRPGRGVENNPTSGPAVGPATEQLVINKSSAPVVGTVQGTGIVNSAFEHSEKGAILLENLKQ